MCAGEQTQLHEKTIWESSFLMIGSALPLVLEQKSCRVGGLEVTSSGKSTEEHKEVSDILALAQGSQSCSE